MEQSTPDDAHEERKLKSLEERVQAEQLSHEKDMRDEDLNFLVDSKEAMMIQKTPHANLLLYVTAGLIGTFVIWAAISPLDEIVKAKCKAVSQLPMQIIKNQNGGTLEALYVKEGQQVKAGEKIAKLVDTSAAADKDKYAQELVSIKAKIALYTAETTNQPIVFPSSFIQENPLAVKLATDQYSADKKKLDDDVATTQTLLDTATEKLASEQGRFDKGYISLDALNQTKDAVNKLKGDLASLKNKFQQEAQANLNKATQDENEQSNNLKKAEYALEKTLITSPIDGTINQINTSTIGSTIEPTTVIMDIAPSSSNTLVVSAVSGNLDRLMVANNQHVVSGEKIGEISNPALLASQKNETAALAQISTEEAQITASMTTQTDPNAKAALQTQLNAVIEKKKQAQENLKNINNQIQRLTIVAPDSGVIDNVSTGLLHHTVSATTTLMEIIPDSKKMVFECQIPPKDKAFLHIGDTAKIMLDTFPFAVYGSLTGKLVRLNPGLISDPNDQKNKYFEAEIDPQQDYVISGGVKHQTVLHMEGQANIVTGKKTVMAYLLKPFTKAQYQAMTER